MKYTDREALSEIARRSKEIKEKKLRRTATLLSGVSGALFLLMVTAIAALPKGGGEAAQGSVYGSFLVSMEAGGYVLVGVLAFCFGVALTLLCLWINKLKKARTESSDQTKSKTDPEDRAQ